MADNIEVPIDIKAKGKGPNGFLFKIHRDVNGTTLYGQSEALHSLLKMFSKGQTQVLDGGYKVWRYRDAAPEIVQAFSGDIYNIINSVDLNTGVTVTLTKPVSRKFLEETARNLQKYVEKTIQDYCSAVRINVNIEVSDPIIRWDRNVPVPVE
jgi:hypothetical protein